MAVRVNQHDGRVDSVLDIHNTCSSPWPVLVRENGRVTRVWQADARIRSANVREADVMAVGLFPQVLENQGQEDGRG